VTEAHETHRLSRKEREAAWRKSEIIEAAGQLFASKGFEATSLQEIAEASEFSIGTLYNFFENKEDIYFAVIEADMGALHAQAERAMSACEEPKAKLEAFVRTHFTHFQGRKDIIRRFWQETGGGVWTVKERLWKRLHDSECLPVELLIPVFDEAKAAGEVQDVDSRELAMVFHLTSVAYFIMWFRSGQEADLVSKTPTVVKWFLEGYGRRG